MIPFLLLIDLSAIYWSKWHAAAGEGVNAAFEYTIGRIVQLVDRLASRDIDRVLVALDVGRTWRHELYAGYKAKRAERSEESYAQLKRVRSELERRGLRLVLSHGHEADDVIATLTRIGIRRGYQVTIATADKDLMQLVGSGVRMWSIRDDKAIGPAEVEAHLGVPPELVADYLALVGDTSDNIQGARGIGPAKAKALLAQWASLAGIRTALERVGLDGAPAVQPDAVRKALIDCAPEIKLAEALVSLRDDIVPADWEHADALFVRSGGTTELPGLGDSGGAALTSSKEANPDPGSTESTVPAADAPPAAVPDTVPAPPPVAVASGGDGGPPRASPVLDLAHAVLAAGRELLGQVVEAPREAPGAHAVSTAPAPAPTPAAAPQPPPAATAGAPQGPPPAKRSTPANRWVVTRAADKAASRFILAGGSGRGKTFLASTIERGFLLPVEEGLKGISQEHAIPHFDYAPRTLDELYASIAAFERVNARGDDGRPFRHLILDSLSGMERLVLEATLGREGVEHMEAKDYGKVWRAAEPLWTRLQTRLDEVRATGTHIWLVAHAAERAEATPSGDMFQKWDLLLKGNGKPLVELLNLWRAWADYVFFLDWSTEIKRAKGKRAVAQHKGRVLYTTESGTHYAKQRGGLPPIIPATWEDLSAALARGVTAPDAKLHATIETLLPDLEPADRAAIVAGQQTARGPALAALLSRAQGMLASYDRDEDEEQPVQAAS